MSVFWFELLEAGRGRRGAAGGATTSSPPATSASPTRSAAARCSCGGCEMIPVECVARGYLAGSGTADYRRDGAICGVPLPDGPRRGQHAARADLHAGDEGRAGRARRERQLRGRRRAGRRTDLAGALRDQTLAIYARGAAYAASRGLILADTKLEFGLDARRHAGPRRRGAHAGLVAVLARRGLRARARCSPASTSSTSASG